jgi:hypothetical protein
MQTQKVIEIVSLRPRESKLKCSSPKCDGRPARWLFPQAPTGWQPNGVAEKFVSCSNHLAAIATVVEMWHVEAKPVPGTQCADFGTEADKPRPQCGSVAPVDKTVRCERYQGHYGMHITVSGMHWGSEDAT